MMCQRIGLPQLPREVWGETQFLRVVASWPPQRITVLIRHVVILPGPHLFAELKLARYNQTRSERLRLPEPTRTSAAAPG